MPAEALLPWTRFSNPLRPHGAARLLLAVLTCACGGARLRNCAAADERPNLILIMVDDLGYETIGANGGTSYATPVLDQLAATGTRFAHCYVQPLCTPTRVQLMTGQYNVRNYIRFGVLDPQATTFGNLLRDAGYRTCIVGKWQLGRDVDLPQRMGFDESCLWQHTRRPPRYANPGLEIDGVAKDYHHGEYGPDLVCDYAIDFIRRRRDQPFLLYYPMMLTHDPYQATPDSPDWDPQLRGERNGKAPRHFGEMVAYMDKIVGRITSCLDELQLREKTLLVFLGDNGTGRGVPSQMGDRLIRGGKGTTTDAGMHVPLIAHWPGTVPPQVCHDLVDSTDFLPTLLEAAGASAPAELPLDGRSFLPQLKGEGGEPREWIYSWYCPRPDNAPEVREFALDKRFKLYRTGEFFDRASDPLEQSPIAPASRDPVMQAAAERLRAALGRFAGLRPAAEPERPY